MLEFNRRDIKAMIMGPKPPKGPEGKNVLWMDTHSAVPLLRVWLNDRWTAVENTDSETIHIDFEDVKYDVRELQSYFRQDRSIVVTNIDCRGGLLKLGNTEFLESQLITFLGFDDRITALEQEGTDGYTAGDNITIEDGVISAIDTTYDNATEETSGLMSYQDKIKLNGLNNYVLPKASTSVLGGIKVGDTLTIDANGVLNALSSVSIDDTTIFTTKTWSSDKISGELSGKQDTLTAGNNITINGNTISANDTIYSAGANIEIVDNAIKAVGYRYNTTNGAFAEGDRDIVVGETTYKKPSATVYMAHAEGCDTKATGIASHAEGGSGSATGTNSHVEGSEGNATGTNSHVEGRLSVANGYASHAEGQESVAEGVASHTEGYATIAQGKSTHSEGLKTLAIGNGSHTEGSYTITNGNSSHAEGQSTTTSCLAEHAQGSYNISHKATDTFDNAGNTIHSIGIGTAENARKNAVEVMQNGDAYLLGVGNYDGTATKLDNPSVMTLQDILKKIAEATGVDIGVLF